MEDIEIRSLSGESLRLTRAEATAVLRFVEWSMEHEHYGMSDQTYLEHRRFRDELKKILTAA